MNYTQENIFVKRKYNSTIKGFLMYLCEKPHNNLPLIVEVNEDYYVMEYIKGVTLAEFCKTNTISLSVAKKFVLQLLDAVEVLHKHNIVHRDINPDNIIISDDGTLKLIDFDIAREIVKNKSHDTQILGTVGYAAPEQFGFTQTDERSDIYAIGVLYKFMVCDILDKNKFSDTQLLKIITKCTQIDQKARYKNVSKLRRDVESEFFISYQIFDVIPGFRTGNIFKMIFATSAYMIFLVGYIMLVADQMPSESFYELAGFLAIILVYLIYDFLFFAFGTNFLNIADKIKLPFKKKWKKQVFVLAFMYIAATVVSCTIHENPGDIFMGNPINATVGIYLYLVYSIISSIAVGML